MQSKEYQQLVEMAKELEPSYFDNNDKWADSPFGWIKNRPIKKIGEVGARMVVQFLRANQFTVSDAPGTAADKIVNNKRVAIKFATLSKGDKYTFNQIRDHEYDILMCIGVSPRSAHGWITPKQRINNGNFPFQDRNSVKKRYSFGPQHDTDGNANNWNLSLTAPHCPPWMHPRDGDLCEMCNELRKLTISAP